MAIERQDPRDPNNTLIFDDRMTEAEVQAELDSLTPETGAVQGEAELRLDSQVAALRAMANPSKSNQKAAEVAGKRGSKQAQVKETSDRIKLDLAPEQATVEELRAFAATAEQRLERDDRVRSPAEFAEDAAVSVGRGAVQLGQSVLGSVLPETDVSDVTENPYFQRAQAELKAQGRDTVSQEELVQERLEQRSTLIKAMQDANKLIESFNESQSAPLQARRFANQEELNQYREERKAEIAAKGELTTADKVQTVTEEFFNTVAAYASRPSLAIDLAFENVADIVLTGGLGKAMAIPREIAEGGAEAVAKWAATEAGQKELKQRATAIGVTTTAVQEGLSAQAQVTTEIEEMSHDDLVQSSPEYTKLLEDGLSEAEAKARLQETAGNLAFGYAGLFAGVGSLVTGGGEFSANLFNPTSRIGKTLSNLAATGRGATVEAAEETIASGGSQLAANIAKQETVNEDQDLTEGVGEAAATGAVAAGTAGGASGLAANVLSATSTVTDKAASAKKNRETKKEIQDNGIENVTTDVNDPEFSIGGTLRGIAARNNVEGVTQEEKATNYQEAVKVWTDYREQIATLEVAAESAEGEQAAALTKRAEELRTEGKRYANIMSQLHQAQIETNDVEEATQQVVAGDTAAAERVLGSILIDPSSLSDENADALLGSGNLNVQQQKAVEAAKAYNRAEKGLEDVATDIFQGTDGFRGLNQYQEFISNALASGNEAAADKYMADLENFAAHFENKAKVASQALNESDKQKRAELLGSINLETDRISPRLVRSIQMESDSITAMRDMMVALQGETDDTVDTGTTDVDNNVSDAVEGEVNVEPTIVDNTDEPSDSVATEDIPSVETEQPQGEVSEQPTVSDTTSDLGTDTAVEQPVLSQRPSERDAQLTKAYLDAQKATEAVAQAEVALNEGDETVDIETLQAQEEQAYATLDALVEAVEQQNGYHLSTGLTNWKERRETAKRKTKRGQVRDANLGNEVLSNEPVERTPEEADEAFRSGNVVKEKFVPRIEEGLTSNPLQVVQNFNDLLAEDNSVALEFLDSQDTLTPEQEKTLGSFAEFAADVHEAFDNTVVEDGFARADYMHYLKNEDGSFDQNVKSAVALAMYNWMANKANETTFNTWEDINGILGRQDEDYVGPELQALLQDAGTVESNVINDMGKAIVKTLGIKAGPDAGGNAQTNLEQSFGLLATDMLIDSGLLKVKEVNQFELAQIVDQLDETSTAMNYNENAKIRFISLNGDVENNEFANDSSGSNDVLGRLFKTESFRRGPVTEKPTKTVKRQKGTQQDVAQEVQDILLKHSQREHYVKKNQQKLFAQMTDEQLANMMGFKDPATVQQHLRSGVEGKNGQIMNSIKYWREFHASLDSDDTPFYFNWEQWKNQRVGIVSNTVNPQGDKLHRHLLYVGDQRQTISMDNTDLFLVGIAQGFGLDIDKQEDQTSRDQLDELVEEQVMMEGIHETMKMVKNEPFQMEKILAAVDKAGEKAHSMDALVAYAEYRLALREGVDSFETDYSIEGDGVTNGPAIASLQFAVGTDAQDTKERLKRVSVNLDGDEQQFGEWKSNPLNDDNYQAIARDVEAGLEALPEAEAEFVGMLVGDLTAELEGTGSDVVTKAGRNLTKNPLMTAIYGSGERAIKRAMGYMLLDKFYDKLDGATEAELDRLAYLMDLTKQQTTELKKAPLDFKLTNKQEKFIVRKGAEIYGEAVYNAVNDNYASFMERRTTVNNMMQVVFELYRQQRDVLVQKKTEEAVAAGIISGTFETLPARLMAEVEKELEAAQPVMHSYFSAKTGNLNEAIYMAKSEMQVQEDSKHRTEAKRKGKKGSRNTFGRVRTPIDGGVSPTVLAVQGTDAATMLKTLDNAGVLNVHDAIFTGTANGLTDMQSINENFYNVMTEYSIVDQAETSLIRALEQAELFDIENDTNIRGSSELKALLNKINGNFGDDAEAPAVALETFRSTVNSAVASTEAGRAETLPRITYMAQYYMENGGYETGNPVTEQPVRSEPEAPKSISYEDAYGQIKGSLRSSKKRLGNTVEVIVRKATTSDKANHKRFGEKMALFGEMINKGTVKQALEVFEPNQLETVVNTLNTYAEARPVKATVQTENQQNINPVDQKVLKAVQEAKDFRDLVARLGRLEKGMTPNARLLNMVHNLVDPAYKVEIFDANKHGKYAALMAESRGLHDGDAKLILLGAPDAQWSGISTETILHEMLHAALVQRMKDSKNPAVIKAKQDLQNILTELKKHHSDKFGANSLANIDELIAWTLTSAQMQDALASVDIKYENRVKSALSWMKGILTSVFGSKEPRVNNALGKTLLAVQNVVDAVNQEAWDTEGPFFSDAAGFNTRDFTAERTEQVSGETLTTTFDRLGTVGNKKEGKAHSEYLRDLLGSMVGPVMQPIKLHMADAMGNTHGAITGDDVYIYTQMTQEAQPLPSGLAASHGSKMSAQEVFTHEMTHSVLREAIDGNSRAKRELMKLFRHVKKNKLVTVEDLMDNPQNGVNSEDYKNAKATYNYVMNIRTTSDERTGKSAYLHEFAAYALTNEKFMAALSRTPVPQNVFSKDLVADTWVQTVRNFFDTALNYVMGRLSGLQQGMNVDEAVKVLAMELAGVEAKNKHKLVQYADAAIDVVTTNLNKFTGATRNEAQKMGSVLQKSNFRLVRTAGNVLRWEYEGIVGFMEHLAQTKLLSKQGRQSFLASMITDALGRTQSTARFHDMARRKNKLLDHDRKQIEVNTAKTLNGAFDRKLNSEEKTAITKAALKTDLTKLWDFMNLGDISRMLTSRTELEKEISLTLGQLRGSKNRGFYYRASQALGYYMATGNVYEAHTLLNAENIAKMVGVAGVPKDWKNYVDLIDKLASLYAIRHTSEEHNARLAQLIAEDEHGVGFVLDMHKQMKEADKTELFDGDATRIIKGYTRDLIDNNISVVQVPRSEVGEYEKQGYVIDRRLTQDKHVILDEDVVQMVNKYGGANAYAAGIISLTSKKAKGSAQTEFAPSDIKASKKRDIQEMRNARRIDPTMQRGGQLLPNVNANGVINSYRYVMNEENKERLLNRHNDFDAVMGSMAAHSLDKKVTPEVNREVIDGLREEFNASNEPEAYIEVSPKSEDPILREYWATLPEETKAYAKEVFGSKRIYVRRDAAPIVFGNRKLSAADLVDHDKAQRSWAREALVQFSDHHLGPKAAGRIRKAEDMWKEFVKETKEFIVVKSGIVTLMNAISNTSQLFLEGMSLGKALEWQREAYVEARRYRRHSAELFELEKQVELQHSTLNQAKARERIAELRHELATSPVAALIEDGMLQSIVEDVELADDTYSHKSQLTQKVEALTTKLPGFIRKGAKVVYMSHDSQLFKLLNEAAQLSDFVSRYALYKHKTEQGMSHNEAAGLAMDVFINYDMPTNPVVQYLNDMGVLWFTKYYFRIQKQIIRNFRENTARNLMFNVLNALTGGVIPSVIDSIIGFDTLANRVRLPDNPLDMISNSLFIRPFTN